MHENFVNLFGLGRLNNIYLGLFHSTLAPVTGKRSNRGETRAILANERAELGQWTNQKRGVKASTHPY